MDIDNNAVKVWQEGGFTGRKRGTSVMLLTIRINFKIIINNKILTWKK